MPRHREGLHRSTSRYQVQSVARALDMIDLLAALPDVGDGFSVTEIASRMNAAKSTAFSTLNTLVDAGFVAATGGGPTKRYRLGPALIRLGTLARAQISLSDLARPYLIDLARKVGATTRLAVLESDEVVVIDQVNISSVHRRDLRMGARELLHSSALGKSILSALTESHVRSMLVSAGMPKRTTRTMTEVDDLLDHLRLVASVGYALDDEEDADGVFCVGAPIRDHEGECVGAISITGIKLHQPTVFYRRLGEQVEQRAKAVSKALGYLAAT